MDLLKFSKDSNAKLKGIREWTNNPNLKVYSFSLLSGFSCPKARDCKTFAIKDPKTGKRSVMDGKNAKFRCFAAIQEAQYKETYEQRNYKFQYLLKLDYEDMFNLMYESIPREADMIRVHVGGDMFSKDYFKAWYKVAAKFPHITFWAYTKSLNWLVELESMRPDNFKINASRGSKDDPILDVEKWVKTAEVIFHPDEANGLPIDHDERYALTDNGSFNLLIHGTQKQGSNASDALKRMNKEGVKYGYSRA